MAGLLILVRGLPGVGKTTLARALAAHLGALYLRVDSLEQALRGATALPHDVGDAGYRVLIAAAEDNLQLGRTVVADAVVPILAARDGLYGAAHRAGASTFEVEVVCSDRDVHRARASGRTSDIAGLVPPTWAEIESRAYENWAVDCTIDTARAASDECLARLLDSLQSRAAR